MAGAVQTRAAQPRPARYQHRVHPALGLRPGGGSGNRSLKFTLARPAGFLGSSPRERHGSGNKTLILTRPGTRGPALWGSQGLRTVASAGVTSRGRSRDAPGQCRVGRKASVLSLPEPPAHYGRSLEAGRGREATGGSEESPEGRNSYSPLAGRLPPA